MTAALAAGRRNMDWAGVHARMHHRAWRRTIRDVLLGHYPLVWIRGRHVGHHGDCRAAHHSDRTRRASAHDAFLVLDAIGWSSSPWPAATWPGRRCSLPIVIVAG
jgi:uncharacterized membrane protein YeiH